MSTMTAARPKIKPTRRTARSDAPFGAGLTRFVPFAVTAPGYVEPSDEDNAWAAANLNDEPEPYWDAMAEEAAYLAWCEAMTPPPAGHCRSCGEPAETDRDGLCDRCEREGIAATIAGENGRAGLGYRVF